MPVSPFVFGNMPGTTRKHPNGVATALQRFREAPASPTWATLPHCGVSITLLTIARHRLSTRQPQSFPG